MIDDCRQKKKPITSFVKGHGDTVKSMRLNGS